MNRMNLECICGQSFTIAILNGISGDWTSGMTPERATEYDRWIQHHSHCAVERGLTMRLSFETRLSGRVA